MKTHWLFVYLNLLVISVSYQQAQAQAPTPSLKLDGSWICFDFFDSYGQLEVDEPVRFDFKENQLLTFHFEGQIMPARYKIEKPEGSTFHVVAIYYEGETDDNKPFVEVHITQREDKNLEVRFTKVPAEEFTPDKVVYGIFYRL